MESDHLGPAKAAVVAIREAEGDRVTFPSDRIWSYLPAEIDIPSSARPGVIRQLHRLGFIAPTGATTRAESGRRKSSPTTEYRLGPEVVPNVATDTSAGESAPPSGASEGILALTALASQRGLILSAADVANFYLALSSSPLVILAGISGTGKSWLPRIFAQTTESEFHPIPVKPHWDDGSDLLGYTPTLDPTRFVEKEMTKAVLKARSNPERLVLVLLDEMNLAHVEHYFSDFLSVIESRRRDQAGNYVTDALPLDLPVVGPANEAISHLIGLQLPPNLRVVGTANTDETTKSFSPKVLDRAFSIEFGKVDLTQFAEPGSVRDDTALREMTLRMIDPDNPIADFEVYDEARLMFDAIASQLEELNDLLSHAGLSFGYRTRSAILLYLWHWKQGELSGVLPFKAALDLCILQKVLPRIRGTGEQLRQTLVDLEAWLESEASGPTEASDEVVAKWPYLRSAARVRKMISQLDAEGATSFWQS